MSYESARPLTFETLLTDPMTRMLMHADGVTLEELVSVMAIARDAVVARERSAIRRAGTVRLAMCEPA